MPSVFLDGFFIDYSNLRETNTRDAGRGQGFVKNCLTLTERASDATRAPAYEPIPAGSEQAYFI